MEECPHCGEPIDENAESCPHCGSDFETGWNPDAESESIELPEQDDEADPSGQVLDRSELRWEKILSAALILAAALAFVWVGARAYGAVIIPFALLLAVCFVFFYMSRRL